MKNLGQLVNVSALKCIERLRTRLMGSWLRYPATILVFVWVISSLYQFTEDWRGRMTIANEEFVEARIGRYAFDRPKSAVSRLPAGNLRGVDLKIVQWPEPPYDGYEGVLADALRRRMSEVWMPPEGPGVWRGGECQPGTGIALFHDYTSRQKSVYAVAVVRAGSTGIRLELNDKPTAAAAEAGLCAVALALRPQTAQRDAQSGLFYLGDHAFDLPFADYEDAGEVYEGGTLFTTLYVNSNTYHDLRAADGQNIIANLGLAMMRLTSVWPGLSVQVMRSQMRDIAGMTGEEVILHASDAESGKPPRYTFAWTHSGKTNGTGSRDVEVKMETPDGNYEHKLGVWNRVLSSLRPL